MTDKTTRVLRFPDLAIRACTITAVRRMGKPGIIITSLRKGSGRIETFDLMVHARDAEEADRWLMEVEMAMCETPLADGTADQGDKPA